MWTHGRQSLVPISEHINRLVAIRAQADIMGRRSPRKYATNVDLSHADDADQLHHSIDPRDHAFILGATNANLQPLNDLMIAAEQAGKSRRRTPGDRGRVDRHKQV